MKHIFLSGVVSLLKFFGLDAALIIAGVAGGVAFISKSPTLSRAQKFLSVLSGGCAANYLTPLVAHWMDLSVNVLYGVAFLLGYGGMKSIEGAFVVLRNSINSKKQS